MGRAFLALLGVVAGVGLVQVANGLVGIMVPLSLGLAGFSAPVVGLVVTAHSVGFLLGGLSGAAVVRRFGFKRTFAIATIGIAAVVLALILKVDPWLWGPLRFATGIGSALLFMVAESWITAQSPGTVRGRVLGLYMTSNRIAFALGQLMLAGGGDVAPLFFLLSAACYAVSAVPISLSRSTPPALPTASRVGVATLYRVAPASLFGAVGAGLMNTAVVGITPLYGLLIGLSTGTIAALAAVLQIGGLALQWPLGWLSDRGGDRRFVVAGVATGVALLSVAIALAGARSIGSLYMLFSLWGGLALALYGLCLSHAGDRAAPHEILDVTGGLLLAWAAGATIGPSLGTIAMEVVGPAGLFYYAAAVALAVTIFCLLRRIVRAPPEISPGGTG